MAALFRAMKKEPHRPSRFEAEAHAASLRSPSHSATTPPTWFPLDIIGDAIKAQLRPGFLLGDTLPPRMDLRLAPLQ